MTPAGSSAPPVLHVQVPAATSLQRSTAPLSSLTAHLGSRSMLRALLHWMIAQSKGFTVPVAYSVSTHLTGEARHLFSDLYQFAHDNQIGHLNEGLAELGYEPKFWYLPGHRVLSPAHSLPADDWATLCLSGTPYGGILYRRQPPESLLVILEDPPWLLRAASRL